MKTDIKVLFVDDDLKMGQIVSRIVKDAGYQIHFQTTLIGLEAVVREWQPQLVLLDVEVGNGDGIEAAPHLLRAFPNIPIVFVSSHTDMETLNRGLAAGGMIYLRKPFDEEELLAYIRRYACQPQAAMSKEFTFGNFRLRTDSHELYHNGELLRRLPRLEGRLLELLIAHCGEVVERDWIVGELWGEGATSTAAQSLSNLVSHLRKCLEEDKDVQVETVSGQGYRILIPTCPN